MTLDDRTVQCDKYGFSLPNMLRTALTPKHGWREVSMYLPEEKSEEEC